MNPEDRKVLEEAQQANLNIIKTMAIAGFLGLEAELESISSEQWLEALTRREKRIEAGLREPALNVRINNIKMNKQLEANKGHVLRQVALLKLNETFSNLRRLVEAKSEFQAKHAFEGLQRLLKEASGDMKGFGQNLCAYWQAVLGDLSKLTPPQPEPPSPEYPLRTFRKHPDFDGNNGLTKCCLSSSASHLTKRYYLFSQESFTLGKKSEHDIPIRYINPSESPESIKDKNAKISRDHLKLHWNKNPSTCSVQNLNNKTILWEHEAIEPGMDLDLVNPSSHVIHLGAVLDLKIQFKTSERTLSFADQELATPSQTLLGIDGTCAHRVINISRGDAGQGTYHLLFKWLTIGAVDPHDIVLDFEGKKEHPYAYIIKCRESYLIGSAHPQVSLKLNENEIRYGFFVPLALGARLQIENQNLRIEAINTDIMKREG